MTYNLLKNCGSILNPVLFTIKSFIYTLYLLCHVKDGKLSLSLSRSQISNEKLTKAQWSSSQKIWAMMHLSQISGVSWSLTKKKQKRQYGRSQCNRLWCFLKTSDHRSSMYKFDDKPDNKIEVLNRKKNIFNKNECNELNSFLVFIFISRQCILARQQCTLISKCSPVHRSNRLCQKDGRHLLICCVERPNLVHFWLLLIIIFLSCKFSEWHCFKHI